MPFGFEEVEDHGGRLTIAKPQREVINSILSNLRSEVSGKTVSDSAVKHGLCLGWSAQWIHHHSRGTDFWKWLQSSTAKGDLIRMAHQEHQDTPMNMVVLPHQIGDLMVPPEKRKLTPEVQSALAAVREKKKNWAKDWIVEKGILSATPTYEPDKDHRDPSSLAKVLTSSEGFKLIRLVLKKEHGNHAVAVSVSGQRVVYMDPNGGEAEFDTHAEFHEWFCNSHMRWYQHPGVGMTDYNVDAFPCPVNATVSKKETLYPLPEKKSATAEDEVASKPSSSKRGAMRIDPAELQQALAGDPSSASSTSSTDTTTTIVTTTAVPTSLPRPRRVDLGKRGAMRLDSADLQEAASSEADTMSSSTDTTTAPVLGRRARRRPEGIHLSEAPDFSEEKISDETT